MKALMTLAAAAALLTGVAAANAQSTAPSTNMAASGSAWCLQDAGSTTAMSCKFASKEACQKEAKPQGQCIQNPKPGSTTGSGSGGAMKK